MNTTTARTGLIAGIPLAALAIGYAPLVAVGGDLPDRIATHYDASGGPDDSMTVAQFAVVFGLFIAVGLAMLVAIALASRRMPRPGAVTVGFLGGFIAGMGTGILSAEVINQRGNASWQEASSPWWTIVWAIVLGLGFGAAAARMSLTLPVDRDREGQAASMPALALAQGEHAVWAGRISSSLMTALGLGFGLVGAVLLIW